MTVTPPTRPSNLNPHELTSFSEAKEAIVEFEKVLLHYGIKIAEGSDLETVALNVMELEDRRLGKTQLNPMEDVRKFLRKSVSLFEMVKLLLRQHQRTGLAAFVPHLYLLNKAKGVAQNERVISDEATNKLFELFIAMICLSCGEDLVLDDPKNAKGDNPDILVTMNKRRWGLACKVIEGRSPLSWFSLLAKGIDQIEKSPAETGCVVFNLKNLIDHNATWPMMNEEAYLAKKESPIIGSWAHHGYVMEHLLDQANYNHTQLIEMNGTAKIEQLFVGKKSVRSWLSFFQTTTGIRTDVGPLSTTVGILSYAKFGTLTADVFETFQLMNESLHHRL